MGEAACTSLAAHQLVFLGYTAGTKGLLPLYPQQQTRSVVPQAMALRARRGHCAAGGTKLDPLCVKQPCRDS